MPEPHQSSKLLSITPSPQRDVYMTLISVIPLFVRHTDDGGAARSRCLDRGLLPQHPHRRGKGRQQETHTSGAALTSRSCCCSVNKT